MSDSSREGEGPAGLSRLPIIIDGIGGFLGETGQWIAGHPVLVIHLGIIRHAVVLTDLFNIRKELHTGKVYLVAVLVLGLGDGKLSHANGNNVQHLVDVLAPTHRVAQIVASLCQCLKGRPGLLSHPIGMELDAGCAIMLVDHSCHPRLDIIGNPLGNGQLLPGLFEVVLRLLHVFLDLFDQGLAPGHGRRCLVLLQEE